jgi:hypothetical protein
MLRQLDEVGYMRRPDFEKSSLIRGGIEGFLESGEVHRAQARVEGLGTEVEEEAILTGRFTATRLTHNNHTLIFLDTP